ncbi:MAG: TIR domain-containing protein, partial [Hyphomonadaceae bacterium]
MTVFILHSEPDHALVNALARAVERRGHFVELETGERVGRPLQGQDALILFWSQAMADDPSRLAGERRALDAWADGRLVIVAADDAPRPVGVRDLPAVRLPGGEAAPTWEAVHAGVAAALAAKPPPAAPAAAADASAAQVAAPEPPAAPRETPAHRRGLRGLFILIALFGLIALAVFVFRRLQYRAFEEPLIDPIVLAAGVAAAVAIVAVFSFLGRSGRGANARKRRRGKKPAVAGKPSGAALFVAYAHDDAVAVGAVVAAVERAGRPVWVDASNVTSEADWAREVASAIRSAPGVLVMCSQRSFQSDHVKREVYLA